MEVGASKLRLITFLGKGRYEEVRYIWSGEEGVPMAYQTRFIPEAIVYFLEAPGKLEIKEVLVLVTEEVKQGYNLGELQKRLTGKLKVKEIPEGRTEADLWNIFNEIVSELKGKEEEIVLDITHGFRSIPMIVFSVADYLRKIESITIRYILYGAYDAGAYCSNGIKSVPVFDLTPLLDLIDWTGGLETFLRRGEATLIGEKMREKHASLYRQRDSNSSLPHKLQSVGKKLQTLSRSLHLARAQEVLKDAHDLLELLEKAKSELEEWAKPFATIIDRVRKELEAFAYEDVDKLTRENLERQLNLIRYYTSKELLIQATLLAREWIVSYVIYRLHGECGDWTAREKREQAEKCLNDNTRDTPNRRLLQKCTKAIPYPLAVLLTGILRYLWRAFCNSLNGGSTDRAIKLSPGLLECWRSLADLRNDLAHCGMRENPIESDKIKSKVEEIVNKLEELFK